MHRMLRSFLLPLLAVGVVAAAAACGGGNGGDDPTAVGGATATASASRTISAEIEGDFVAPDSHAFTQRFELGGLGGEQSVVIIGADAWVREGAGDWQMFASDDPDVIDLLDLTSADPTFLDSSDLAADLGALDSVPDEVSGVASRRYFIPREAVATLIDLFGGGFVADAGGLREFEMAVWLAEDSGVVMKADLLAIADPDLLNDTPFAISPDATVEFTIRIERTQVNDPDIVIEPPAGEASGEAGVEVDTPFDSYHYTVDLVIQILEP